MVAQPYFNPRTRVGCDEDMKMVATAIGNFNPRTRVGCDTDTTSPGVV